MSEFSEYLKQRMFKLGLTQSALAEKIGASPSAVSLWVRGKHEPQGKLLARIEEVLGEFRSFMTVDEVAHTMNVSRDFVQQGLIDEKLPFGWAVKTETGWEFYISPKLFKTYIGE